MAGTINIPLSTVAVGTHDFGPIGLADTDTLAVLTIDRTVANGFNSQPGTTQANISIFQSNDGGATWTQLASESFIGGVFVNRSGQINASDLGVSLWAGTGRQARAEVIISGASVAVQGSLVIS